MATVGSDVLHAQKLLEEGNIVSIPTETVYGLAGNAYEEAVVQKIFSIKKRPSFDPLIVHAGSLEQIQSFVKLLPSKALLLAKHFWPGPLTLVLQKKQCIPELVTAGLPSVAVRIPQHTMTLQLLQQLSFPLAAPSANPFGYISPTTPQHVQEQLGEKIPYILAGGACAVGIESTIIGFESAQPVIYRLGGISLEAIQKIIGPVRAAQQALHHPQAPGMLANHYAPKKPLVVGLFPTLLKQYADQKIGILALEKLCPEVAPDLQVILSPAGSLDEAAQHFFAALRTLDSMPIEVILASPFPHRGIGQAINDRLKKAAVRWINGSLSEDCCETRHH